MTTRILARSVHGLEWLAADEVATTLLSTTDIENLNLARRELTFALPRLDPALLGLRSVDDVFLEVGRVESVGTARDVPPLLAKGLTRLPFEGRLTQLREIRDDIPAAPRFDVVASLEGKRNYNRFAVENAIGAALAPILGASYLERTDQGQPAGEPDLTVRVFLRGTTGIAALRVGRRPLHRRAYKQDTGPGTLHPPVAAAMARLAGGGAVVLDPFCGDGTIVIETALAYPDSLVLGSDLDPTRLNNARRNARRARVAPLLVQADVTDPPWRPGAFDSVLTNPPWNVAVAAGGNLDGSLEPWWRQLSTRTAADGRICTVTDMELEVPTLLRRWGFAIGLEARIRLAGRVSDLVLCAPPGHRVPTLVPGHAAWRDRAIAAGVLTDTGF